MAAGGTPKFWAVGKIVEKHSFCQKFVFVQNAQFAAKNRPFGEILNIKLKF